MLLELDNYITFLIDHLSDDRISLTKKMKYGFRSYHISFLIDGEPNNHTYRYSNSIGQIEITFDNRNQCIEIIDNIMGENLTIEDQDLLTKWNPILEEIVNQDIGGKIQNIMDNSLSACHRKDLHREHKMGDIFNDDKNDL